MRSFIAHNLFMVALAAAGGISEVAVWVAKAVPL
jgi:hypothetical protein